MTLKKLLPKNISKRDRMIRLVVGIALLGTALLQSSIVLLIAGLFCLFEAAMSWCVVYQTLGINTCRCKKDK